MADEYGDGRRSHDYDGRQKVTGNLTLHGTITIPQQEETQRDDQQTSSHTHRSESAFHKITTILNIGVALFVGLALIGVGCLQYGVYSQQAAIMKGQNSSAVGKTRISSYTEVNPQTREETYVIWGVIKNSGGDIARISLNYTNFYETTTAILDTYDFHNLPGTVSVKDILLPQSEVETEIYRIPQTRMDEMRRGERILYIYGTIKYSDQYRPDHITMYCMRTNYVGPMLSGRALVTFAACNHHNCIDEGCKGESEAGLSVPP